MLGSHTRTPVGAHDGEPRGRVPGTTWAEYLELGLTEIRHYGADSMQIARRMQAAYARLLQETAGEAATRVEFQRELLNAALATRFEDGRERAVAAQPDRMGLGAGG